MASFGPVSGWTNWRVRVSCRCWSSRRVSTPQGGPCVQRLQGWFSVQWLKEVRSRFASEKTFERAPADVTLLAQGIWANVGVCLLATQQQGFFFFSINNAICFAFVFDSLFNFTVAKKKAENAEKKFFTLEFMNCWAKAPPLSKFLNYYICLSFCSVLPTTTFCGRRSSASLVSAVSPSGLADNRLSWHCHFSAALFLQSH